MGSIGSDYSLPSLEDLTLSNRKEAEDKAYEWFQAPRDFAVMTREKWLLIKGQEEKKHRLDPVLARPKAQL